MGKYFATLNISNKRIELEADTLRSAKVKAGKETIYANEVVQLFKDDGMGGQLLATKKEGYRWENSFI